MRDSQVSDGRLLVADDGSANRTHRRQAKPSSSRDMPNNCSRTTGLGGTEANSDAGTETGRRSVKGNGTRRKQADGGKSGVHLVSPATSGLAAVGLAFWLSSCSATQATRDWPLCGMRVGRHGKVGAEAKHGAFPRLPTQRHPLALPCAPLPRRPAPACNHCSSASVSPVYSCSSGVICLAFFAQPGRCGANQRARFWLLSRRHRREREETRHAQ